MPSDFIDRPKLETMAEERYPMHLPYNRKFEKDAQDRVTFMAGVDAALALLDAEMTEERSSRIESLPGGGSGTVWYARRVTPWLSSEGGEKP